MYVSDLALDYFRSYRSLVLRLPAGPSVFLGANGQGKTNLLEAINYLAVLASHRISADSGLIFRNQEESNRAAVIRARLHHAPLATPTPAGTGEKPSESPNGPKQNPIAGELLEIEIVAGRANRAMINRHPTAVRNLIGHLSTVLFAPQDLELVAGDPASRRRFLDQIIIQLHPTAAGVILDYQKVLRQRGAYLKDLSRCHARQDEFQLQVWDEQLAPLAAKIMRERQEVADTLTQLLPGIYAEISPENPGSAALTYADSVSKCLGWDAVQRAQNFTSESELTAGILQALQQRREDEIRRGVNLVGPHRDELNLELNGFPVRGFASHGENWSFALALRLAQYRIFRSHFEDPPVLLLDDVFAELDGRRKSALVASFNDADQVLITSATGTEIPLELQGNTFHVAMNAKRESEVSTDGQDA